MKTIAAIAAELGCSERQAKRELVAAVVRHRMHLDAGLERGPRHHLEVKLSSGKPGFLRAVRRFPDAPAQDRWAPSVLLSCSPPVSSASGVRRSGRCLPGRNPMQVTVTAPALTDEVEQLPLDASSEAWNTLVGEAAAAIDVALAEPRSILFSADLVRADAGTFACYSHHVSRMTPPGFWQQVVALYGRAKRSIPELCPLLLAPEMLQDVASAAAAIATPADYLEGIAVARNRAAADAVARFERAIAEIEASAGDELATPARAYLAALALRERLDAARAKREEAERLAAAKAAADARAAAEAEAEARDAAELELELTAACRRHGLPADLRTGMFVEQQTARLRLAVRARRRLSETGVDAIRVRISDASGLFGCRDLARSMGDASVAELTAVLRALDVAEGRTDENTRVS